MILEYLCQSSFPTMESPARCEREKGAESELKEMEKKCITIERNLEEIHRENVQKGKFTC